MGLKKQFSFLFLIALAGIYGLSACNGCNTNKQDNKEDTVAVNTNKYRDTVKLWTEQRMIQWTGWLDSSMHQKFTFDSLEIADADTLPAEISSIMPAKQFNDFNPYFIYSPDSSQVIDLLSYGNFLRKNKKGQTVLESGEPDTEVAIINVQTKKRERILFTGPSTLIKEAIWVDNQTVLIGGAMYDENNVLVPVLWKYSVLHHTLESWQ